MIIVEYQTPKRAGCYRDGQPLKSFLKITRKLAISFAPVDSYTKTKRYSLWSIKTLPVDSERVCLFLNSWLPRVAAVQSAITHPLFQPICQKTKRWNCKNVFHYWVPTRIWNLTCSQEPLGLWMLWWKGMLCIGVSFYGTKWTFATPWVNILCCRGQHLAVIAMITKLNSWSILSSSEWVKFTLGPSKPL